MPAQTRWNKSARIAAASRPPSRHSRFQFQLRSLAQTLPRIRERLSASADEESAPAVHAESSTSSRDNAQSPCTRHRRECAAANDGMLSENPPLSKKQKHRDTRKAGQGREGRQLRATSNRCRFRSINTTFYLSVRLRLLAPDLIVRSSSLAARISSNAAWGAECPRRNRKRICANRP